MRKLIANLVEDNNKLRSENAKLRNEMVNNKSLIDDSAKNVSVVNSHSSSSESDIEKRRSINSGSAIDRANYDFQCVNSVLNHLDIECVPCSVYRMGRSINDRPRLLKVVLPTSKFQQLAVKRAPRLRSFQTKGVYLRPSLSFEERMKIREARLAKKSSSRESSTSVVVANDSGQTQNSDIVVGTDQHAIWYSDVTGCNKKGGGVAILVRDPHPASVTFSESVKDAYEVLACDIWLYSLQLRVIAVYRAPSCPSGKTDQLIKAISDLCTCNYNCIVAGDFNINHSFDAQESQGDAIMAKFASLFRTHGLIQKVSFPTRHNSLLDLLLCNDRSLIRDVRKCPPLGSSDHCVVKFCMSSDGIMEKYTWRRDFRNANFNAMRSYLSNIDWFGSFNTVSGVNEKYDMFVSILHHAMDMFIPYQLMPQSSKLILPGYLTSMVKTRERLWNKAVFTQSSVDWAVFQSFNKKWTAKLAKYKAYVEKRKLTKGGLKALYSLLRARLTEKQNVGIFLKDNSHRAIRDYDKANVLADTFENAFHLTPDSIYNIGSPMVDSDDSAPWFDKNIIVDVLEKWSSTAAINSEDIPFVV
ncbi:hypothetical protein OSTOST_08367, partial [Ostertagia ostertagi]